MAETACRQCNAWYNSEHALRDHMRTAHRAFDSEQDLLPSSVPEDRVKQGCTTSFLAERENEMGQSCARTPAEEQEEYPQPDEENGAGGEPN